MNSQTDDVLASQGVALDAAIEAVAKALADDRGLDLDNLAAHADPGDTAEDLAAWRANFIDDGRIAIEAAEPVLRKAVAEQIARRIELKRGERCPECGGKPAGTHHDPKTHQNTRFCGGGHRWPDRQEWHHPAEIAREVGRG